MNLPTKIKKQSKAPKKQPPKYEHATDSTLSLNASAYLPSPKYIDPMGVNLPNKLFQKEKIILDMMSKPIKKNPFPLMAIMLIIMIGAVAATIVYNQIGKPYLQAEHDFEIKKLQGNLTSADKAPSLFNFQLPGLSVPGVKK